MAVRYVSAIVSLSKNVIVKLRPGIKMYSQTFTRFTCRNILSIAIEKKNPCNFERKLVTFKWWAPVCWHLTNQTVAIAQELPIRNPSHSVFVTNSGHERRQMVQKYDTIWKGQYDKQQRSYYRNLRITVTNSESEPNAISSSTLTPSVWR